MSHPDQPASPDRNSTSGQQPLRETLDRIGWSLTDFARIRAESRALADLAQSLDRMAWEGDAGGIEPYQDLVRD